MALLPNRDSSKAADRKAKTKAAQDEALLREVDDAVRTDQYRHIWENYGRYIIIAVVVGLGVFAAILIFTGQSEGDREKESETLVTALDQLEAGNVKQADEELAPLAEDGKGGAKAQAQMLRAGIAQEEGRTKEAIALFEEVAQNGDVPESIRDLAELRAVIAGYDTLKPSEVIRRLTPLAQEGEPFFGSAAEVLAMAHLEAGDEKKAGALFAKIAESEDVPETIRGRARQMASVLGVDAVGDVDELVKDLRASAANGRPVAPAQ
ncbi:tetratricopeptide repeat protein [Alteriqipengyuania sp.]|uniref:tetratricopeptide repeat protein n=1 Tax=Alteriqipengyuania sp. TaxID=2800692 RepID=UPI00351522DF